MSDNNDTFTLAVQDLISLGLIIFTVIAMLILHNRQEATIQKLTERVETLERQR